MGKGTHGKSSATAGTRKKHAKKNAQPPPEESVPKTKKGKKERGKKEPRQKIYIPPVKPAPVQPDPLETTGLAHSLPADLLIVLRSFNKKAEVTKIRALEELQAGWIDKCLNGKGEENEVLEYTVVEMLPVWLHHVSALFLHPSRRVRALTASLHASLLQIAPVREQLFFFLKETASTSQAESILGSWCVAANDVDRTVATAAMKSWKDAIGDKPGQFKLEDSFQTALVEFVQRIALDPAGIYAYLNPVQPSVTPMPQSRKGSGRSTPAVQPKKDNPEQLLRSKLEESEEEEQDRKARLRFGALGALKWILEALDSLPETLLALFGNPAFLTSLQPNQFVSWIDLECFGYGQSAVRKNMWNLLLTLFSTKKGALQDIASELARAILRSAFIETDSNVQSAMWYPLLLFLKEYPNSWELEVKAGQDDKEEDDSEDEGGNEEKPSTSTLPAVPSAAYQEFLQFLQLGCSGSPIQGYPTVVIVLSTISPSILASSSSTPLEDLFSSFWAALDGRALSSLNRMASAAAFLSSLLECMVLILKRVLSLSSSTSPEVLTKLLTTSEGELDVGTFSKKIVTDQMKKVWDEAVEGKLKIAEKELAKSIMKTIESLKEIDPELSNVAWGVISAGIFSAALGHSTMVSRVVQELRNEAKASEEWSGKVNVTIAQLAEKSMSSSPSDEASVVKQRQQLLTDLLETFKEGLFSVSTEFRDRLDELLANRAYELMKDSPAVFLSILAYRGQSQGQEGMEVSRKAWSSVLVKLADSEDGSDEAERGRVLKVLVDAAQAGKLPDCLRLYGEGGEEGVLDDLIGKSVVSLEGGTKVDVVRGILVHHDYFISRSAFSGVFETLCASLKSEIKTVFDDPSLDAVETRRSQTGGLVSWTTFETLFSLVSTTYGVILASKGPRESTPADDLASDAFLFAYLLPLCEGIHDEQGNSQGEKSFSLAAGLWEKWFEAALEAGKDAEKGHSKATKGLREVRQRLKGLIIGTKSRFLPQTVLTLLLTPPSTGSATGPSFFSDHPEFSADTMMDFMPTVQELDTLLSLLLPGLNADPSMGVLEPLVPPPTAYPYSTPVMISSSLAPLSAGNEYLGVDISGYDRYGYSAYARGVTALATVFSRDRACAKSWEGVEFMRHLGVVEVCAWDGICVPSTLGSEETVQKVFGELVPVGEGDREVLSLAEVITKIEQVMTYVLLVVGGREPWKRYVLDSLALASLKAPSAGANATSAVGFGGVEGMGGVKKTVHATMNVLSNMALDWIGRAVQGEMDMKAGVAPAVEGWGVNEQRRAVRNAVVLNGRVVRRLLERLYADADEDDETAGGMGMGKTEMDGWVVYARKIERVAPLTSVTILATITSTGVDSPKLDRARNEFAASLLGVPSHKANAEGLELLRTLAACVPYDDAEDAPTSVFNVIKGRGAKRGPSDVIMLPVQRAVNVARACQQWVEGQGKADEDESEDDDDEVPSEDLESAMLAVFIGLSPILQNVPGKHWDFMWDVLETTLENATLEDESSLLGLSYALRFVRVMEDLVRTNKQLKAEWSKRRVAVLGNVRDLLLEEETEEGDATAGKTLSVPRSVCRELVLSIVQSLPGELIDQETLGKMCHLVADSSVEVQKLSYGMLKQAAEKRTEWIVIEVGVGSMGDANGEAEGEAVTVTPGEDGEIPSLVEAPVEAPAPPVEKQKVGRRKDGRIRRKKPKEVAKDEGPSLLPKELISIIQRDEEGDLFGWMLGWMLVFDLFKDVSLKVKSMYIEQLRNLDIVGSRLLPFIVQILRLDEGLNKAVKVELWAVDEFYVPYYEPISAPALAAHLYYRALLSVPSLVAAWVLGCKDRQLNNAITTLTSQQFSPLIIRAELSHLKSPEGIAELTGEGLSVKVVGGNSEVIAAYVVDEHQLEIKLKIPPDWPLHKIEVRDEKRVGVDENRWRAWVLGVQQTIWTHNGRIVDGLSLWKKNRVGREPPEEAMQDMSE
ncbi:hypothetical protein D9611_007972 [Ephemerocybe angulata]|uniref:E3 ubiquitin-protein ligase listerin n=1 Tax=Ephemerocybe angulata TaxID=980116 RepID=A0A8H5CEA7_9AGAR|nr:hypothetical protein D9611_007972 [Tulosesus angulatus]